MGDSGSDSVNHNVFTWKLMWNDPERLSAWLKVNSKLLLTRVERRVIFKGYQMIYFYLKQSKTLEVILSWIFRSFSLNQLSNDLWRDDVVKLCVKFGELAGLWTFSDMFRHAVTLLCCGVPQGSVLGPFMFQTVLSRKQPYRLWRLTLTSRGFK